jgi:hypothetical protein
LDKSPSKSARSTIETLCIAHSTAWLHLHDSIGCISFYLHWVLHSLTHHLREKLKEYVKVIWPFLHAAERNGWSDFVTRDESGFVLNVSFHRV